MENPISLSKLVDVELTIPIYQRNYAWGREEIEQLLRDLNDIKNDINDQNYYLGVLVLDEKNNVVDGQQRLTTLNLLWAFLKSSETSKTNKLKFQAREECSKFLDDIFTNFENRKNWESNDAVKSMQEGLKIIETWFAQNTVTKKDFCAKLGKAFLFVNTLPKDCDLNHYFEVMNNRGAQLEHHEILKAKLMSFLKNENEEAQEKFANAWAVCAEMDTYAKIPEIKQNFKFSDLNIFDDNSAEDAPSKVKSIIKFPHFLLLTLKISTPNNSIVIDDKKLIEQFEGFYNNKTAQEKSDFSKGFIVKLVELRKIFDSFVIKQVFNDKKQEWQWEINKYEEVEEKGKKYWKMTKVSDKNTKMLQAMWHVSYPYPRQKNYWLQKVLENQENSLENLAKEELNQIVNPENDNDRGSKLATYINDYKGTGFSHFVFNFLDYLLWKKNRNVNFEFKYRNSVEHWYPRNPRNGKIWEDKYLHNFGNLALISGSSNSRFTNDLPKVKSERFKDEIKNISLKLRAMKEATDNESGWTDGDNGTMQNHKNEMLGILQAAIPETNNSTQ